jgi:hypothetical protein
LSAAIALRIAIAMVSLLVLAWVGVMERNTRLQARGIAAVAAGTPADLAHADSDFRAARFLNPDTTPDLARSLLYEKEGRIRRSIDLVESILRREPENLTAWGQLFTVSRAHDPAAHRRALAAIRRIDPLAFGGG